MRRRQPSVVAFMLALVCAGCPNKAPVATPDAGIGGAPDAAAPDAGGPDAGIADTGIADTGAPPADGGLLLLQGGFVTMGPAPAGGSSQYRLIEGGFEGLTRTCTTDGTLCVTGAISP